MALFLLGPVQGLIFDVVVFAASWDLFHRDVDRGGGVDLRQRELLGRAGHPATEVNRTSRGLACV